ncbi:MAG TPA: hypothetical protein LFW20_06335 [Rickettsia endosymbiont of Omalisus fontisbellaquei]|nr:hypothetical protein [Rickettsia endosymbiont of Omalisus fontisbellaquei]
MTKNIKNTHIQNSREYEDYIDKKTNYFEDRKPIDISYLDKVFYPGTLAAVLNKVVDNNQILNSVKLFNYNTPAVGRVKFPAFPIDWKLVKYNNVVAVNLALQINKLLGAYKHPINKKLSSEQIDAVINYLKSNPKINLNDLTPQEKAILIDEARQLNNLLDFSIIVEKNPQIYKLVEQINNNEALNYKLLNPNKMYTKTKDDILKEEPTLGKLDFSSYSPIISVADLEIIAALLEAQQEDRNIIEIPQYDNDFVRPNCSKPENSWKLTKMQQEAKNLYKLLKELNLIKPPIEEADTVIKEGSNWDELEKNWKMLVNEGKAENLKYLLEDYSGNKPTETEDVAYRANEPSLLHNAQGDTLNPSNPAIGDDTSDNNSLLLDFVGFIIGGAALITLIGYIYKRYNENSKHSQDNSNSWDTTFLLEKENKDTSLLGGHQETSKVLSDGAE